MNNKRDMAYFRMRRLSRLNRLAAKKKYYGGVSYAYCPNCGKSCVRKPNGLFLLDVVEIKESKNISRFEHREHICRFTRNVR